MRAALVAALVAAQLACAGAGHLARCSASLHSDARELIGEGEAPLAADDAANLARRRAVAALAEQLEVEIATSLRSTERESTRDGRTHSEHAIEEQLDTRASAAIEGAAVRESCAEGANERVRVAVDRGRFVRDNLPKLEALAGELRALEQAAEKAESAGERLAALSDWLEAEPRAAEAARLSRTLQLIGGRAPAVELPSASSLARRVQDALSRLVVRLDVEDPETPSLLSAAGATCLASAGLPVAARADAPDLVVSLRAAIEPSLRVAEGLYVARGTLSAAARRPKENASIAGSDAHVKGGGADASAAQHDALRKLARESAPAALDQLLAQLFAQLSGQPHSRWAHPCSGARP